jgi:hypothetical protein
LNGFPPHFHTILGMIRWRFRCKVTFFWIRKAGFVTIGFCGLFFPYKSSCCFVRFLIWIDFFKLFHFYVYFLWYHVPFENSPPAIISILRCQSISDLDHIIRRFIRKTSFLIRKSNKARKTCFLLFDTKYMNFFRDCRIRFLINV